MDFLNKLDQIISSLTKGVIVIILSCMLVMSLVQILLRNFYGMGIEWGDIFLRHLVLWIGFLGAIIATGENRHISMEIITKFISDKPKKILSLLISLFVIYICLLLSNAAFEFLIEEKNSGSILFLNIPTWYFITIIPIGYFLIAVRFFISLTVKLNEVFKGNWKLPPTEL